MDFLGPARQILFVPYALADHAAYTRKVQNAFDSQGITVLELQREVNPLQALDDAEIIFVGGGNTFRLLRDLQGLRLLEPVRQRVLDGTLRYIGSSAGTNVACPTIRTTNDMPIVQPETFDSLGLVPFQINPHYLDPNTDSTHMGETREERLVQFLEENDVPVVGMREGSWLRRNAATLRLDGLAGARLFQRGQSPREIAPGTDLSWLLEIQSRFD